MNLLHSIKAHAGDSWINVIIEIPFGSKSKIEYDNDKGDFVFDRIINTEVFFPFNYGFIPETWESDGDPLDAIVLSSKPLETGNVVASRIIGMLATNDEMGADSKLITVPKSDTTETLDKKTIDNIEYFYKHYKLIEPEKWVDIDGYFSKEKAEKKLSDAVKRYHQHFQK